MIKVQQTLCTNRDFVLSLSHKPEQMNDETTSDSVWSCWSLLCRGFVVWSSFRLLLKKVKLMVRLEELEEDRFIVVAAHGL